MVIINKLVINNLKDTLIAFLTNAKSAGCCRITVAYSGGIDSHVLLSQLHLLNKSNDAIALDAIYINHNLQPLAAEWGLHCETVCHSLDIPFKQINVQARPEKGESPEEKARDARYAAFESEMQSNHWLLTAQHQEDQAETLLLQLLRGSGAAGLAAMPFRRKLGKGEHVRPLLDISKAEIEKFASQQNLSWVEDPTNLDQSIARNYLRKSIFPVLKVKWSETARMLSRSANWLAEASTMMTEIAEEDLQACYHDKQSLNIHALNKFSAVRQKNILRHWFHKKGLKRPGQEKLGILFDQIINAREDASPELNWQGVTLRRYQNRLYVLGKICEIDSDWQMSWDLKSPLELPTGWASLNSCEVIGKGLDKRLTSENLVVKIRKGGETCHPSERSHSRSLKKLFQEYSIPPWQRDRWPLIYLGEQLVAVPGLFICKGFEARSTEKGVEFVLSIVG
ncbi:MAG: tRNA lysidine(34) synthetase TilS [Gammaproteobacteria bacterium]|nr:MAG: tRNA lysidine(34) synthetase TilS [Gammaproteobacteria bacterium]